MSTPSPRTAIVTGAAAGIGRAIALRLAQDGLSVVVNDLSANRDALEALKAEIEAKGGKAHVAPADATDEESVKGLVKSAVQEFGGLDVMVANAGGGIVRPFLENTVEDMQRHMNTNFIGTFLAYKYAAEQMILQGRGGRLIGASSFVGKKGTPAMAAYTSSKFAIRGLTQSAAQDLGPHRITVNAYCPGIIASALTDSMTLTMAKINNTEQQVMKDAFIQTTALKRIGRPEDIARVVSFLASEDSEYMTGQSVNVDGGMYFD